MLAWIVAGAVAWHRDGLGSCTDVDNATAAWRRSEDIIEAWWSVNVAARVLAEAGPNQIVVSDAARREGGALANVGFEPVGRRVLKGITEPLELYVVQGEEDHQQPPHTDPVCGMQLRDQEKAARTEEEEALRAEDMSIIHHLAAQPPGNT